jgi:ABC-type lipoprotein release transport system permease subunit
VVAVSSAALGASKLIASLLYEVKPTDAWALGTAVVILLASAAGASFVPARSASRIDPLSAVRHE